jgi:DNA gyrase subunit A
MDEDDVVVGMEVASPGTTIATVSERGYGKRTDIAEYRVQTRGGKGTINLKTVPKVGMVAGILQVVEGEDIMLISSAGNIIRMKVDEVPLIHRSTQGVRLIDLAPEERVVGLARAERESEEKNGDVPPEGETSEGNGTDLLGDVDGPDDGSGQA